MSTLHLHLLGTFDIRCDDEALLLPPTLKAQSLLAYLALHRDRPQPRQRLAGLFWGDRPERKARHSLATALWLIRRCFPHEQVILSDPHTVQFDPHTALWLDVEEFEHRASEEDLSSLQAAADLYRGDLLDGFYDDWIISERYRLEALYLDVLARLMAAYETAGNHEAALAAALRLLDKDLLREDAHRLAMRAYCRLGQRNAALEQYRRSREIVQAELGTEPMAETTELYQAILEGRFEIEEVLEAVPAAAPHEMPARPARTPLDAVAASPLVGREEELTFLQRCWQEAQAGQGRLLLIGGEAGVGKSRLIQEFADRLRWQGTRVLWGRCYQFERLLPYQPIAEALQSALPTLTPDLASNMPAWVLGEVARLTPEVLELPAPAQHEGRPALQLPPAIRSDQERARLFDGVARFLMELSRHGALLIVLEDLHWATETTLQLLHYLVRHLSGHPVLLLGSHRTEEIGLQHPFRKLKEELSRQGLVELLPLPPLSAQAVEELVVEMSGAGEAVVPLARRLHRKTEGNPFFIVETVKALFETGVLRLEQDAWQGDFARLSEADLPLPAGVSEIIRGRVRRLDDDSRAMLGQAAVIGREFDFDVLNALRGEAEEATLTVIERLLRHRLIAEGTGAMGRDYAFTHHLIQEVIYADLPQRRRQHMHGRVAEVIQEIYAVEAETLAGELAFHFRQGRRPAEALAWMEQAAAQARQRYAIEEAVAYYGQALALTREVQAGPERESALLRGRAEAHLLGSAFDQARADLEEALALAKQTGDERAQAESLLLLADLHAQVGEFDVTVVAARQAHTLAEACRDERLAGIALRFEGQGLYFQGQSRRAIACAERACESLAQAGAIEEEGWGHVLLATTHLDLLGEFDAAHRHLSMAHNLFEESGCIHGRILADHIAGNAFLREGDYQSAVEQYARAVADARRIGHSAQEAVELAHLAISQAQLGDLDAAERDARACRDLSRRLGMTLWEAYGTYWLGHVAHERGDLAAARKLMEESLSLATQSGYHIGMAFTKSHLSHLHRDLGTPSDLRQALTYAEAACELACQVGSPVEQMRALSNQAMAHLALGRLAQALSLSEQAVALAGQASAEDFSQELLFNHARVLRANGQTEAARRYLDQAHAELMNKAARIRDPRLKRSFLENVHVNREILAAFEAI